MTDGGWRAVAAALLQAEEAASMHPPAPQLPGRLARRLSDLSFQAQVPAHDEAQERRGADDFGFDWRSGRFFGRPGRAQRSVNRFAALYRRWQLDYQEPLELGAASRQPLDPELLARSVTFKVKLVEWARAQPGLAVAVLQGARQEDVYGFWPRWRRSAVPGATAAVVAALNRVDGAALTRAAATDGFPVPFRDARLPELYRYVLRALRDLAPHL